MAVGNSRMPWSSSRVAVKAASRHGSLSRAVQPRGSEEGQNPRRSAPRVCKLIDQRDVVLQKPIVQAVPAQLRRLVCDPDEITPFPADRSIGGR